MEVSWTVMLKSSYVLGHVFMEDDQIPDTVKKAFDMMIRIHGRDEWETGASKRVEAVRENIPVICKEKEEASSLVLQLKNILEIETLGLPPHTQDELNTLLNLYIQYVNMIEVAAKACYYTALYEQTKTIDDYAAAQEILLELQKQQVTAKSLLSDTDYPHYIY